MKSTPCFHWWHFFFLSFMLWWSAATAGESVSIHVRFSLANIGAVGLAALFAHQTLILWRNGRREGTSTMSIRFWLIVGLCSWVFWWALHADLWFWLRLPILLYSGAVVIAVVLGQLADDWGKFKEKNNWTYFLDPYGTVRAKIAADRRKAKNKDKGKDEEPKEGRTMKSLPGFHIRTGPCEPR